VAIVGVGVDAVDVGRFRRVLERRPGFAHRVFTDAERDYAQRHHDPVPRLAARFAAREAAMKALGVGLGAFKLRDVEVVRAPSGAPSLALHAKAAALASERGVERMHLALTHEQSVALAFVVAEGG
jgi:holo-[acyl-carrier protein] synthase